MGSHSWFTDPFAKEIFDIKYKGDRKDIYDHFHHLAKEVSLGDQRLEDIFYKLMITKRFSPGGRILAYAGRPDAKVSLMNCTTHEVPGDSLEDISDTAYTIMRASSRGQGIGIDISNLRPVDSPVNNAAMTSTGAISFMQMFNNIGATIGQEGRRAALLFSISDRHPDLYRDGKKDSICPDCGGAGCGDCNDGYIPSDFLNIKRLPGMDGANISVRISDEFMQAVQGNNMWSFDFAGKSGIDEFQIQSHVPARDIFDSLAFSAHSAAEPGVLFWDTAKRMSNSDLFGWPIVGVNACSEQVLDQDGVCNLGSMNLAAYVQYPFTPNASIDLHTFYNDVGTSIEFLDNVIDIELYNMAWISEQQRESLVQLRRVGLGIMGVADALAMLGLEYSDNTDTRQFLSNIFRMMRDSAYSKSVSLAYRKMRPAGVWLEDKDRWENVLRGGFFQTLPKDLRKSILNKGTRNVTLLSIAPTGTISNLFGVSSGIEPLFAPEFTRRVRMNGGDEFIKYVHPGIRMAREMGLPDSVYQTTYDVSANDHIAIQSLAQIYTDQSISKTLNMPKNATPGDVAQAYRRGWDMNLKGMTVYVDESRQEQVLYQRKSKEDQCPQCGGDLKHEAGCTDCVVCTYSVCSI